MQSLTVRLVEVFFSLCINSSSENRENISAFSYGKLPIIGAGIITIFVVSGF